MDLFILDSQLRRTELFDRYESLIWTERFAAYGDFQLVIHSTLEARNSFSPGTKLAINESTRIMQVETVEDSTDSEGRTILTVKGPSLEDAMSDRVARDVSVVPYPEDSKWYFNNMLPADIIRQIFQKICVDGTIDIGDKIPFYTPGNIYPVDSIPEPPTLVSLSVSVTTVYDAIKQLCDIYDLGFRLVRNGDNSELMFNVYSGNDRTTLQNTLPAVIFSPELDNLSDVSYLTSISAYKNVAYVVSPKATLMVYGDNVPTDVSGFDRRVLHVDASDETYPERPYTVSTAQKASINAGINLTTNTQEMRDSMNKLLQKIRLTADDITNINLFSSSTLTAPQKADIVAARDVSVAYNATEDAAMNAILLQRGKEALAVQTTLSAFDGEIPKNSQYKYHQDYELGDLVEVRNSDKVTNNMRVTEQIFVSDAQGDRAYPTLAVKLLITAGSWYAWPAGGVWDDITDPAVVWDTV